ncbi:hypothetical protein GCM10009785_08890 [Brooklawnia cerclae]|uniref:Uncharacterized protein n=2 Tax=Actinomycetes TaxID=1760 RepID=A0A3Q8WV21_9ACTO|nr:MULTISPECIES: DsrE family protein [Actinomycetes]AFI98636.1 hypothetical protein [Arthrobacter sp. JBH1]AZN29453.1 hypothetical protein EJO69_03370 [Flaviflexus salsibiostraticola]AZN30764.1 hypothetical protein EJO69_10980 [Flaviflexus salsibiostraticola]UUE22513.1 DsrE family protein [Microbacterium sp. J1-1]
MMNENSDSLVFVLQHKNDRFDPMPFSIARSWTEDLGADIALYVMYDALELIKKDAVEGAPDIRESLDALLAAGVSIYACGFCSRACELSTDDYYPGIQVANRQIFHGLMSDRRPLYW